MNPFTGPVFSRPDGLDGVTWHQFHGSFRASERPPAEAAIHLGGRAFARLAFARLRSSPARVSPYKQGWRVSVSP